MIRSIFTPRVETRAPSQFTHAEQVSLSETERARLRLVVARLGEGIADDTSLFSSAERQRLLFLRWLEMHGKLSS
jgi:hypothetical protein